MEQSVVCLASLTTKRIYTRFKFILDIPIINKRKVVKEEMSKNLLLNEGEKYGGQYVATKSFKDKDVISHGNDLGC